jgi:hypothetical protein
MCEPVSTSALISAGVSALGGGVTAYSNNQATKARDQATAANIMQQQQLQRQGQQQVSDTVKKVAASNPDSEKQVAERDFLAALQRGHAGNDSSDPALSGAGQRYAEESVAANKASGAQAKDMAATQAAVEAPTYQRLNEGNTVADAASKLSLLRDQAEGQNAIGQLRIGSIAPSQAGSALGSFLTTGGQALAGKDWSKKIPQPTGLPGYPTTGETGLPFSYTRKLPGLPKPFGGP